MLDSPASITQMLRAHLLGTKLDADREVVRLDLLEFVTLDVALGDAFEANADESGTRRRKTVVASGFASES